MSLSHNSIDTEIAATTLLLLETSSSQLLPSPSPFFPPPVTLPFDLNSTPSPYHPRSAALRYFYGMDSSATPSQNPKQFTRRSKRIAGDTVTTSPSFTTVVSHSALLPNPPVTSHGIFPSQPSSILHQSFTLRSSLKTAKPVYTSPIPPPHPSATLPRWKSVVTPYPPQLATDPDSTHFRVSHRKPSLASSSKPSRASSRLKSKHISMMPSVSPPLAEPDMATGSVTDTLESTDEEMADMAGLDQDIENESSEDHADFTAARKAKGTSKTAPRVPHRNPTDCILIDRAKHTLFPTTPPQIVKDGIPNLPEKKQFFEAVLPSPMGTFPSSHGKATYMCITSQRPIIYERSIQLDSFPGQIRELVSRVGWEYVVTNVARVNIHLVMEFYTNFPQGLPNDVHYADDGPIHVSVRGKSVNISPSRIREALQLPVDVSVLPGALADFHDAHSVAALGERLYSSHPKEGIQGTTLKTSHLSEFHKFLAFLVRSMLVPSSNTGKITKSQASFIAWLANSGHQRFPAEAFIFQAIRMAGENRYQPGAAMVFPSLITLLCHLDHVDMFSTDAFSPRITPITLQTIRTSAAHSDVYVEPLETTFLMQVLEEQQRTLKHEFAVLRDLLRLSGPQSAAAAASPSRPPTDPRVVNRRMFMD